MGPPERRRFCLTTYSNSDAQHNCSHHGRNWVGSQVQQIWGVEVLTAASAILTLAVLFLSEIIPKTLGAAYWKRLSTPSAYLLTVHQSAVFPDWPYPVYQVGFAQIKERHGPRDDVAAMADLGETEGAEEAEETIIHTLGTP